MLNGINALPVAKHLYLEKLKGPGNLWQGYTAGKQTYARLAVTYNCSARTIQRKIDTVKAERITAFPALVNVLMDMTCFGRKLAVRVYFSSLAGKCQLQFCNFHQVAIVRRYLTKKPRIQASKELWAHTLLLVHTDKENFEGGLELWYNRWQPF